VDEWLPERHLARFVVEVIDGLDLSAMSLSYRGTGSASYHPALLLGILVYGYATGVFSSRKLERATYDSVAFRFIAANDHPDHDTIATFRRRFLKEIEGLKSWFDKHFGLRPSGGDPKTDPLARRVAGFAAEVLGLRHAKSRRLGKKITSFKPTNFISCAFGSRSCATRSNSSAISGPAGEPNATFLR